MTTMGEPSSDLGTQSPHFGPAILNAHTPKEPGIGRVVESRIATRGKASGFVRHIAIDVSQTRLAGAFRAGQSFGVVPPGADANGKPHKLRLYSIASPTAGEDGNGQILATTVKRTLDEEWETHRLFMGVASNWLCDLQIGDPVPVTGPAGKRFLLPERAEEHRYVFLATGTGIAPFRGMIMELLARDPEASITLISGTPYATDLLYDAEFRAQQEAHPNFRYWTAISRHEQEDGGKPMYVDDRLTRHAEVMAPVLADPRTLVYMCGITGMETRVYQRIAELVSPAALGGYLHLLEGEPGSLAEWSLEQIRQHVRPGPRMLVEVY